MDQGVLVRLLKGQIGQVYLPFAQEPKAAMSFAMRTEGDPAAVAAIAQKMMQDIDRDQPVFEVKDLEAARVAGATPQRLATTLLGGFALVALLLATIGIYGVVAYTAGRRMREMGIRVALGAERSHVLKLILGHGLMLALVGVGVGLAGAAALTHLMSSLLYGVRATDPATFAAVCLLLVAVATLASYIPARRAANADPVVALRQE
jgi:ABC-type antimicrobial peptide transport system permease subunit